jgi:hypothetical protein
MLNTPLINLYFEYVFLSFFCVFDSFCEIIYDEIGEELQRISLCFFTINNELGRTGVDYAGVNYKITP